MILPFGSDSVEQYTCGFFSGVQRHALAGEGGAEEILALGGGLSEHQVY